MDFVQIPEESHIIIKNLQSKYPQYKDILSEIDGNISQSLWHQLSDNLIVLSNKPELQNSQDLIELYHGLVLYISEIVNPMKFLKYVQNMLVNYKNKMNEGLQFIENTENKMKFKGEEEIFLRIIKGFSYLELDKMYDLEDLITDIKNEFESKSEIDSIVYANFYRLSTYFYEKKNNYDEFYNNAFQFLAYEKNLSDEEKLNLCFKMCVSSLIGEKMFNFAELIEKDFFKLMKGSKYEWLYNLILSFNSSNVDQFLNMLENYKNEINSNKILNEKINFLKIKIRIAALLDLIFSKNKNERIITYDEVIKICKTDKNEIEYIVMKALSLKLIKGYINQVEEKITINWIQPKYLDKEKIKVLYGRFENWIAKANKILTDFQENGAPLLNN